ncbi:MAG: YigZ family protein [Treponema sp.]|nr:YigZ family protein [Treponema sp.]
MEVLTAKVEFEEKIKGSRFLSELIPVESQNDAREIIKAQKAKYADSTHVVHAFIIGNEAQIMGMSDDGEPSGTAGRPVLDILKGRKCTNVILTVTRWFGGTLLGTGGLVKAYSGGAKQVIEKADSLKAFSELIEKKEFSFDCDYSGYKLIKNNFENFELFELKEQFETQIKITGRIRAEQFDDFSTMLQNLSNGKIKLNNN